MNKTAPFFQADGKGQPPLSGGTEALPSALSEEKPFDTYEVVARLKDMMLEDIARKKKAFLKDPAGYAISMRGSSGNGQEEKELTSEMRASRHMATQSYLANGLEGFTPKVLTASEAAKAKAVLADDKTPNAAKIKSLVQLHGTYGSLGDTALDELELAPTVRAAVDLAIQNPRQETFAAEFLGAAALPERQKEEAANRLALLAGTNPEANETLALLMADHGKLNDSGKYAVASAGSEVPHTTVDSAVVPKGRLQDERDGIATAWDLMQKILNGEPLNIEAFERSGWITPGQMELATKLQTMLAGEKSAAVLEQAHKIDADLGISASPPLKAFAVERMLANLESGMEPEAAGRAALIETREKAGLPMAEQIAELPHSAAHGAKAGVNNTIKTVEDITNYLKNLEIDVEGHKLTDEQVRAIVEHVTNGGTEDGMSDLDLPAGGIPLKSNPDGPKVALPRTNPGEKPKGELGKAVSGGMEVVTEFGAGGAVLAPVKTVKKAGQLAKGVLTETGVLPKVAQAAMYKSPRKNIEDFVANVLRGGQKKKAYYELQKKDYSIKVASDAVLHDKKRHPLLTEKDWKQLPEIWDNAKCTKLAKQSPQYNGTVYAADFKNGYAGILEKSPDGTVWVHTFFKDSKEGVANWINRVGDSVTPAMPPAALRHAQVP